MTLPHALPHLGAVAGDYDILLCDVWGVIHNGRESWVTPCEALTRFNREGGHVVLISNSPRPASDVIAQLDGLGVAARGVEGLCHLRRRHARRTGQAGARPGLDRRTRA